VLAEFIEPGLSERLQQLLPFSLEQLQVLECRDQTIGSVALDLEDYTGGLSTLAATLLELQGLDVLLLAARYHGKVQVIGRARSREVPLNRLLGSLGGGGHPQAAAAVVREDRDPRVLLDELNTALCRLIPEPLTARTLMSEPVRTVGPDCPVAEAQAILNEAGHTGLPVVDDAGALVGIVTRRDLDLAVHRGYPHAPVRGYMTREVRTIPPTTTLAEIKDLMVIHDIGRLPVLEDGRLVGIVTRTDVLRTLHGEGLEPANRG
jgi:tRNA nucleotidyltransferase (CCA-adding enzyme)